MKRTTTPPTKPQATVKDLEPRKAPSAGADGTIDYRHTDLYKNVWIN